MATVNETCEFCTRADQVQFRTQTNGDNIQIKNLNLSREQATSFAWLVNSDGAVQLKFEIKIKGT